MGHIVYNNAGANNTSTQMMSFIQVRHGFQITFETTDYNTGSSSVDV
jgi:hypothetical protein